MKTDMKLLIKYRAIFILPILCFLSSCNVNTNPKAEFESVKQDIKNETGISIDNTSRKNIDLVRQLVNRLLENELTEDNAIKITLLNNRMLQAEYEKLGVAKANLAQAKLLKNPIFSLSYKFATEANQFDIINMSLFQNFLEALLIPSKKKLKAIELQKTKSFVTNKILLTIANTKNAFYEVLLTELTLELEKKILLAKEASFEFAEVLFEAGNINALELSIKKADYLEAKLTVADMEVALIDAKEKLNQALGLYGKDINWKIHRTIKDNNLCEFSFDNFENVVVSKSLKLKYNQLQMIVIAKKYGIDIANTVLSNFTIGPDSEREDNGVWFVGPAFSIGIPIFDFGKAVSAAAQAELYQQWNNYTSIAVNIRSIARMARINFLNSKRKFNYYQKAVLPLKEKVYQETYNQYNAMQLGVFDLLKAKSDEFLAKVQMIKVQKDFIFSKIELDLLLSGSDFKIWE